MFYLSNIVFDILNINTSNFIFDKTIPAFDKQSGLFLLLDKSKVKLLTYNTDILPFNTSIRMIIFYRIFLCLYANAIEFDK